VTLDDYNLNGQLLYAGISGLGQYGRRTYIHNYTKSTDIHNYTMTTYIHNRTKRSE